jgi:hypothetical protein
MLQPFVMDGVIVPLRKAGTDTRSFTRPMGGWLMTYGKMMPDGKVVETKDRDGHVVEAAREVGMIDFTEYRKGGLWNDTHDESVIVGIPTALEFHGVESPMAKSHGKVGWYTEGHLFDRHDPRSWAGLRGANGRPRTPTPHELDRADHFHRLANLLKGTPRPLGLSAHGQMMLTPENRIVWAKVPAAAVCELPVNPDATLEPLMKAMRGVPLHEVLAKSVNAATLAAAVPQDLEGVDSDAASSAGISDKEQLLQFLMDSYKITRPEAVRWIRTFLTRRGVQAS